jgi:F-type H+-transporting ATPase subunit gamma
MGYQLEKAQSRLTNIGKVKPILGALRTISLGSWQMARNRRTGLARYSERLLELLPIVLPRVAMQSRAPRLRKAEDAGGETARRITILVAGSERGLVGRYNKALVEHLRAHRDALDQDVEVRLMALGSRMVRELKAASLSPDWSQGLSMTVLPPYQLAYTLVSDWLQEYEAYELDVVDIVYNADAGAGSYRPSITRLIPPDLPEHAVASAREGVGAGTSAADVIVETDPVQLYIRIVEQWTAIATYRLLLESAVTEHSARFQLMESATQNADDLIADLQLTVQSARRQAITRQMQELAIASGLLGESDVP